MQKREEKNETRKKLGRNASKKGSEDIRKEKR